MTLATSDWRSLSAAQRELALSPSSAIGGNYQPLIAQYVQRSAAARAWFAAQSQHRGSSPEPSTSDGAHNAPSAANACYGIAYGDTASQTFDLFLPPRTSAAHRAPPLLVFIHGGYWQELSKNESHFCAVHAVQNGLAHAVLDYTLAPAASVNDIVDECEKALRTLHTQAAALGFDPNRITLSGSSAGAHLAAMVALRCPFVASSVLVSGIYELEPLLGTSINHALGLNQAQAQRLSPALHDVSRFPKTLLAVGEIETAHFKQQSADFAAHLNNTCVYHLAGRNHFDVVFDIIDPATELGQQTLRLIQST